MQSKRFISSIAVLIFLLFPGTRLISAQERDEPFASESQSNASKATSMEISPLTIQLTANQLRALQGLGPALPSGNQVRPRLRATFFNSASQRPLTPHEVAMREAVYAAAGHPKQYVRVRLASGKVLTGTISDANKDTFLVRSNVLGDGHTVRYDQLAEPPRPVLALGTRAVKGLEVAGIVALCIVAIPLFVALYPLILTGVVSDC
jgi:hypothetical protein